MVKFMAIFVPGVKRVVVVIPGTLGSEMVRVGDMIVSVYGIVRELVVERCSKFGGR